MGRRAREQNLTVGVSLGGEREVVFQHCAQQTRLYLPQLNGTAYAFGNGINVEWKHGINALPEEEHKDHPGRISIIIWGWSEAGVEDPEQASDNIPAPDAFQRPCLQHQRGKCTYGDRCKFQHLDAQVEETPPAPAEETCAVEPPHPRRSFAVYSLRPQES